MKTNLTYGLAALVALAALAVAPAASADDVTVDRCKSDYTPEFPEVDACVHLQVPPSLPPCVHVWIDGVGGTRPC